MEFIVFMESFNMKIHPRLSALIAVPLGFGSFLISKIFNLNEEKVFLITLVVGLIIVHFLHNYLYKIYYAEEWKRYEERKRQKAEEKRLRKEQKEKDKMDKNDKVV